MSFILFTEIPNQTFLRLIGAQKAINISATAVPDEETVNTLIRKQKGGVSVTVIIQNIHTDKALMELLKANGINAIQVSQNALAKSYVVIDNIEVIIKDNLCAYIISEQDSVQKYLSRVNKHVSLNNYIAESCVATSHLVVDQSNLVEDLNFAIAELENLLVLTENEQQEVERVVCSYTHKFNQHLGSLLEAILTIKRLYAERHRAKNEYAEQEYQQAKQREEQFHEERRTEAKQGYVELSEVQHEDLKKLYREAVLKCHPDKMPESLRLKASELTAQLNAAYKRHEIEIVKQILADLYSGALCSTAEPEEKTVGQLLQRLEFLKNKLQNHIQNLKADKEDKTFVTAYMYQDDPEYFEILKTELEREYEFWRKQFEPTE